jgi:hypothetical protein
MGQEATECLFVQMRDSYASVATLSQDVFIC